MQYSQISSIIYNYQNKMEATAKGIVSEKIEETVEAAEEIVRHPLVKTLARFGFYTKGFLFIVIGVLAILVAVGDREGRLADPTGALATVAQFPLGKIILILFVIGAFGHSAWNILRGAADVDNAGKNWWGITNRIFAIGVGVFYLYLAWSAWDLFLTAHVTSENGTVQKTFVSILLAVPMGAILAAVIGVGVIGASIHECYSGITGKYQENFKMYKLQGEKRIIVNILGYFSFVARALIFALMGYFFISAAFFYDPQLAVGIDGALLTLSQSYYGKTLLFVTATGLVCHGVLSLYEARYRRIC
jgi:hypothetical protein